MSSGSGRGGPYVGAMLRVVWQWVREQLYAGLIATGYDDLNPAHVGIFRYPGVDGLRPTELADQLQITKQSLNDLLRHLKARGYLTLEPDPTDGRARIIRLTSKGRRLEQDINAQAREAELRIAEILGPRRFSQLHRGLEELTRALAPTTGAPTAPAGEQR